MSLRNRYARLFRSPKARPGSKPRPRYRPSLEGLEIRELLSTATWTGKGDGTSFNQATNWTPVGVPNSQSDVVINDGAAAITMPGTAITVKSLTQTSGTLEDNGSAIMSLIGFVTLVNVDLDLSNGDGAANFVFQGGDSTLEGMILPSTTIRVEGGVVANGSGTDAVLTLEQGSGNNGAISLRSITGSTVGSDLVIAGSQAFVNQGTVSVSASTNGTLSGVFTNAGTFSVGKAATIVVNAGASAATSFLQQSGTLDASAGGQILFEGGTLEVAGGTVNQPASNNGLAAVGTGVVADGGSLQLDASITTATTVYATGNTTLLGNDSTMGTVWVEGGLIAPATAGTLTLEPDANDAGSLILQSMGGASGASNLVVPSGRTYVNRGTVTVDPGVASSLSGGFTNTGAFTIAGSSTIVYGGSTFLQQSGTLDASASGLFLSESGTLEIAGGAVDQPPTNTGLAALDTGVVADGGSLKLDRSITAATTIYATGGTTLTANDSTMGTVWVEGGLLGPSAGATLTLQPDANDVGRIIVQSLGGSKVASDLVGANYVNRGSITVDPSVGSDGKIIPSLLSGGFTNAGSFTVTGSALTIYGGSTFLQQAGTLDASAGQFLFEGGTLEVAGGTVKEPSGGTGLAGLGSGVVADGDSLKFDNSITAATTVYVTGATTLISNDSPMATAWVEGGLTSSASGPISGTLTLSVGSHNVGTIVLQSSGGSSATSNLTVAGNASFVNSGTITIDPSTNDSILTGSYTNTGIFNLNQALATLAGSNAALLNATTGQINGSGVFDVVLGSFTNAGELSIGSATTTGTLSFAGNYTQSSTGTLNLKIGGLASSSQFDLLHVSAQATVGGTLNVISPLLNGFSPVAGNAFTVLTSINPISGQFANDTFPTLSGSLAFSPSVLTQTATSLTLTVNTADRLVIPAPTNVLAGVGFGLTVAVDTPSGTTDTAYNGVVTLALASPIGGMLGGTLTAMAVNGVASFSGLTVDVAGGGYTIQATSPGQVSATTNPFTVASDAATQLVISSPPPSSVTAGTGFGLSILVEDASGNTITDDFGNLTIAVISGPAGSVVGGPVSVSAAGGMVSFTGLTLNKVSPGDTLSITQSGLAGATTGPIAVTTGAPAQLVITQQPTTATAGVGFSLAVAIEDAYGNPEPTAASVVTATLVSGAGSLTGTTMATASNGSATFSNLVDTAAGPITIQFSGSSLAIATSIPIVISPAATANLVIQTQPSPVATLAQPFAIQPVVAEVDAYGNIETGDNATIIMASLASGLGPLTGTTTAIVSGGVATFTNLADGKAETISLGFSGGGLPTATSTNIVVGQGTPTIAWPTPTAITYGTALSSSQLDATASVPGTFAYTPAAGIILKAGQGQTLAATFTPTDTADYKTVTTTVTINVLKAAPTVAWPTPAAIMYGTLLGSTQLDATASVPGAFVYSPAAGATLTVGPGKVLSVTFTPTDTVDYTIVTTTVTINVLKAVPVITWPTPANITYGTPLNSTQLDASTTITGTFVYSPSLGTILKAGQAQTLTVTFTPTDTVDYTIVITTVTINVAQAAPLVTWAYPAAITYGTPLGSTQLNATTTIAGTFVYSPLAGTILKVGAGQTLLVTFTPTDAVDYSIARSSVTINVIAAATGTSLAIAPAAATFGLPVVLTATVSGTPGAGTPTGSVRFLDGTTLLGSATLDPTGHAVFSTTGLLLGTQAVTATYSGDSGNATSTSSTTRIYVGDVPKVDFDGDGKVDLAVFGIDPNTGRYDYRIVNSSTGKTVIYDNNGYGYGNSHSIPIVGDFFGDGRASYALWTPNAFGGMTFTAVSPLTYKGITINFGSTTDLPVVADVNGDGIEDFGVYGFQTGLNYRFDFVLSSYNFNVNVQDIFNNNGYGYGGATSIPIVADFDGSGKAGFGIYNPSVSGSTFAYVNPASGVSIARTIGTATDTPTAVDYDGDGKADLALYGPDPTKHGHYRYLVLDSSSGFAVAQAVLFDNNGYGYGNATSLPVMGDYEGNGKADFGLFTSDGKGGNEFVYLTGQTGSGVFVDFATATDIPLTAPTYLVAKKVRGS